MLRKLAVAFTAGVVTTVALFGLAASSGLPVADGRTLAFLGAGLSLFSLGVALLFFARRTIE
ncbi:MAG TPA: hypothetical protein VFX61_06435 [Micromonosporaceae bacterium]|nr:hypothetical protein [Micromonosporaceae bacterium]